jgi:hypothetical protein
MGRNSQGQFFDNLHGIGSWYANEWVSVPNASQKAQQPISAQLPVDTQL